METLQRLHNRGSISTGYDIDNSCKFEPDNSESMSRTPSGNGNLKTCTISFWVKITELNKDHMFFTGDYGGASSPWFVIGLISDRIYISSTAGISGASVVPSRLLRDTSAWYHLVFAFDTTQGTAADRIKIYVNGVQETVFTSTTYPSQNDDLDIMAAKAQGIAGYNDGTDYRFAGYMSEFVGIDGQALAPTEFGEFDADSGIWKPIDVSGLTFGTNGFYLDFKDSANLGNDASGGLDFTETNIAAADQATDSPTNLFCTLNPLHRNSGGSNNGRQNNSIFTEGNTYIAGNLLSYWQSGVGTFGFTKGKWYFEAQPALSTGLYTMGMGDEGDIANWGQNNNFPGAAYGGVVSQSQGYGGGGVVEHSSTYGNSPGVSYNNSNIIGVAIDVDNGYVYYSKDGSFVNSGNPASGGNGTGGYVIRTGSPSNGTYFMGVGFHSTNSATRVNFGGYTTISISSAASDANGYGTFEYAPPSGYYALCTKNLAVYG